MSWHQSFLAFFCAVATSVSCLAQDRETLLDDFPLAPFRFAHLDLKGGFMDLPNDVYLEFLQFIHRPPRIDEISLLNKEWVQIELGLKQSQIKHFGDEYKRIIRNRMPVPTDLLETLDSKQREQILDIRIRCRIRSMGIAEFFSQPQLGLSKEELEAVRELVTELEPLYIDRITELRDDTLRKLRDVLTKEQQEQFDEWSSGFLESRTPPIDLLAWQIRNLDRFEETIADQMYPEFRGFFVSAPYFVDYDGILEEETFLSQPDDLKAKLSDSQLKRREAYVKLSFFRWLHSTITNEATSVEIQSTDEQIDFANRIKRKYNHFERDWRETVHQIASANEFGSDVYAEYERLKAELVAEGTRDLENLLLPHQRRFLETLSLLFEVFRGGFPSAMIYGQTGQTLRLTGKQKKEIEEICKNSVSEIESQTRNWEKEIFSKLKDSFSARRQEQLEFLFKYPVSHGWVNIHLLLKGGL